MSEEEYNRDYYQLVTKYLAGELGSEERRRFEEDLEKDPGKKMLLAEFRKTWDSVGKVPSGAQYNLEHEWALMRVRLPGFDSGDRSGRIRGSEARSVFYYTYRIAAVMVVGLILAVSLIYVTRFTSTDRVVAENEPVEVVLEDGTGVTVNRHSTLRYGRTFDKDERKIYLTGEAWFDVARDTTRPFIIDAGGAIAEVLGTSFNVNAYKKNATVEITVKSGLVSMSAKQNPREQIVIRPGAAGSYHKSDKQLKLLPTSDPNAVSWKTRELYFEGSTLKEVTSLVSRVYGVNIVIKNRELASCTITVTFKEQSLEAILKVLEMTLDLQVRRVGDEIWLDGEGCAE